MTWLIWLFAYNFNVFLTHIDIDQFVNKLSILPRNSKILLKSFIDKSHNYILNRDKVNQLILIQQRGAIHMA